MSARMKSDAARELLAFYIDAGIDVALGETPVDRFAALAPPAATSAPAGADSTSTLDPHPGARSGAEMPGRRPAIPHPPLSFPSARRPLAGISPASPEAAVMAARDAAKNARTLEELRAVLASFNGCALKTTAKRLVFADGNPQGDVMFVGEAPGREEDLEGLPFVGRSGKLLDRMMAAIGLDRSSAYIANIIPWRPPGNRTPTPQEAAICLPFILRQIELADPDILVCLGAPAAQALLAANQGIMRTRGRWLSYHTGSREIRAIATLHPAYLLRQPLHKRLAWRDFLMIRCALDGG